MEKIDILLDKIVDSTREIQELRATRQDSGIETPSFVDIQEVREILEENHLTGADSTPVQDLVPALRKRGYFKGIANSDANKSLSNQLSRAENIYNHRSQGWSLVDVELISESASRKELGDIQLSIAAEEMIEELVKEQQWGEADLRRIYRHANMGAFGIPSEYDRILLGRARSKYNRFLSPKERDILRDKVIEQVTKKLAIRNQ